MTTKKVHDNVFLAPFALFFWYVLISFPFLIKAFSERVSAWSRHPHQCSWPLATDIIHTHHSYRVASKFHLRSLRLRIGMIKREYKWYAIYWRNLIFKAPPFPKTGLFCYMIFKNDKSRSLRFFWHIWSKSWSIFHTKFSSEMN